MWSGLLMSALRLCVHVAYVFIRHVCAEERERDWDGSETSLGTVNISLMWEAKMFSCSERLAPIPQRLCLIKPLQN